MKRLTTLQNAELRLETGYILPGTAPRLGWSITSASEDTLQKNGQGQNPSILLSFQLSPLTIKYWLGLRDSAPTTKPSQKRTQELGKGLVPCHITRCVPHTKLT